MSGTSMFTPPSLQGSLAVPSNFGGINWSGLAWDVQHQRAIVAVSNIPVKLQLIPADQFAKGERGNFRAQVTAQKGGPYAIARAPLRGPSGDPCGPPPWGELVAVDLAAGKIAWRQPLGRMEEPWPDLPKSAQGSIILGGPIVTAGGLIFIGGTMDRRFRALSADTGKELWFAELPASAHALPITYEAGGKQFVVIAAGANPHIDEEKQGDALVAFTLPSSSGQADPRSTTSLSTGNVTRQ